jgi:hypothetical protein
MGELQVGELLQSEHGPVAVASLTFHHRPCEVYNIEVHGEHVYQIGEFGVLVHNACAPVTSPLPGSYINSRYVINMVGAPGPRINAAGFPRNGPWFWRQMLSRYPELFSPDNAAAILRNRAPTVDPTWIVYNPMHQSFQGQILVHHHINQGGIATGLPQLVHQAWHSVWHPF